MFNRFFIEGTTQTYALPEHTSNAIQLLIKWVYTQKFHLAQREPLDGSVLNYLSIKNVSIKNKEDQALVELWVLGDKLLMPKLQNDVAREIESLFHIYE